MTYNVSLDKTAKVITTIVTALFILIISGQLSLIKDADSPSPVLITAACLLIYFLTLAFRPVRYTITPEELIIHRPLLNVRFKRSDIIKVEQLEKSKLSASIRTFGVGGLFGYFGSFFNLSLGHMTWYATQRNKYVLVTTRKNKKIVLTPNDPDSFVSEFTPTAPVSTTTDLQP